jgi:hypothetical protein
MYKHNLPKHVYHYYSIVNILNRLVNYLKNMEFKKFCIFLVIFYWDITQKILVSGFPHLISSFLIWFFT